jgi:hypothetical protein
MTASRDLRLFSLLSACFRISILTLRPQNNMGAEFNGAAFTTWMKG